MEGIGLWRVLKARGGHEVHIIPCRDGKDHYRESCWCHPGIKVGADAKKPKSPERWYQIQHNPAMNPYDQENYGDECYFRTRAGGLS